MTRTPVPLLKEITLAPPGSGVPTMTFPTYFDPVEGTGRGWATDLVSFDREALPEGIAADLDPVGPQVILLWAIVPLPSR